MNTPAVSAKAWEALGEIRKLDGHGIFTIDAPSVGEESRVPLLLLHGFPTSSYDFAAVLEPLRAGRRVIAMDFLGFGLSDKPDIAYTLGLQADLVTQFVAGLGIDRLALLSHDMGDSVCGELLARRAEGRWPVEITRRVLTNGSIYIDQAHLTAGQQMLLSMPDERLPDSFPADTVALVEALRCTFSSHTPAIPAPWTQDPLLEATAQIVLHDGHLILTRLIRYIEERRTNERRFTGAIESDPSPLHVVWGLDDPVAVPSMIDSLLSARPDATVSRIENAGHYPMIEAPSRFLESALSGLA